MSLPFGRQVRLLTCSLTVAAVAALFGIAAAGMLTAAVFVWLSQAYDTITALLAIGIGLLVIGCGCAVTAYAIMRQGSRDKAAGERQRNQMAQLQPDLLLAGLDVVRVIGGRRAASVAAGAIAVYWLFLRDDPARPRRF